MTLLIINIRPSSGARSSCVSPLVSASRRLAHVDTWCPVYRVSDNYTGTDLDARGMRRAKNRAVIRSSMIERVTVGTLAEFAARARESPRVVELGLQFSHLPFSRTCFLSPLPPPSSRPPRFFGSIRWNTAQLRGPLPTAISSSLRLIDLRVPAHPIIPEEDSPRSTRSDHLTRLERHRTSSLPPSGGLSHRSLSLFPSPLSTRKHERRFAKAIGIPSFSLALLSPSNFCNNSPSRRSGIPRREILLLFLLFSRNGNSARPRRSARCSPLVRSLLRRGTFRFSRETRVIPTIDVATSRIPA